MSAIEIMTAMQDQKPAGANATTPGRMSTGSSKSGSQNDFLGMMQMTISEYQKQTPTEEKPAPGFDDKEMGKIILIKDNHPAQENSNSKKVAENVSPGEVTRKPADEKGTDEQKETIATPAFIAAFIEIITNRAKAAGADKTGEPSVLAIQKDGKGGFVSLKDILVILNETADNLGKEHKDILASLAKKNNPLTEANLNIIPEMKNQLVMALEEKGLSAEEIKGILKAAEETSIKFRPTDQSLPTINQLEMKNELVKALEGKGITADVVAGIIKELDQEITTKAPGVKQDAMEKSPTHVEPTPPSFRQAAVAILEKKGFSAEDIKGILKAIDQATVVGTKPDINHRPDQSIFIQQSFHNKEFIKESSVGRKKIHSDIYQKEASLEDFRHENVEVRIKINPPEKQIVKEGPQKELLEQHENSQPSEKRNVFSAALRGVENKQPIVNEKEINAQQLGKVIMAKGQDDPGKWPKSAGDVTAKRSHPRHEEIILPVGKEQSPLQADILSMAVKGADIHSGKTTMDTSKSIYQSVVDQIQDGFALAQNKDNG
ncbi:MAG TPA: hypothetical protein DCG53_04775, partial [Syntrophus sp. (in: bacteria)]|nr:hypothetical protein [Syntrophus sp. (in: bacteria)]